MASEKILVCCLILSCFVSMANAGASFFTYTIHGDFIDCFVYGGHTYYLSGRLYTDVYETQQVCQSIDGYIVQIDTLKEYEAIKNFINSTDVYDHKTTILIDGTDKWQEGNWTFFNKQPLPVLKWNPGNPDGGDCLALAVSDPQMMIDVWCVVPEDWQGFFNTYRFMCEVPE